jgi:8-oxo-dGTP pyrophosphatase MutT (NUDIX family)
MQEDFFIPEVSIQGTWSDGTVWKYFSGADFSSLSPMAAFGVCQKNNAVLLTKNQRGWDIPGGTKEASETIIETMKREMLEETGLVVSEYRPIGYIMISLPDHEQKEHCIAGYAVDSNQPLRPVAGLESSDAKFCDAKGPEFQSSPKRLLIEYIIKQISLEPH